ncbi:MAG: hypothetical protein M1829_006250 [Trizodia sp. TS-e1964]|nr:MAG: hypothetical protein M1829_006250 [Trizodia sp. TS-e1964]
MPLRRTRRSQRSPKSSPLIPPSSSTPSTPPPSRPRRSGITLPSSVTAAQATPPTPSSSNAKKSIRLTVKMPSNKLIEATSGGQKPGTSRSRNSLGDVEIMTGPRGSRAKKPIVDDTSSEEEEEDEEEEAEEENDEEDDDDDEEEEENDEDEDAEGESEDEGGDEDAEGESEDADADGDIDMEDAPALPAPKKVAPNITVKPRVTVTPAKDNNPRKLELKDIDLNDDDDDDELSELESEGEEEEDATQEDAAGDEEGDGDEDAEGDDDAQGEYDEEEDDSDADDATPASGSRASTPDLSKLTRRQRGRLDEFVSGTLLALPADNKIKKTFTVEENALRRIEMARRRKNLSEKRNEEEKMDTINKLLKKQAPKKRGNQRIVEISAGDGTPTAPEPEFEKPNPVMVRWVSNREGSRIGVPEEWGEGPMGQMFRMRPGSIQMVKEVL